MSGSKSVVSLKPHGAPAAFRTGLPVVTEVLETESVELVAEYADVLQPGDHEEVRRALDHPQPRRRTARGVPVQVRRLAELLQALGLNVVVTHEPGATGVGTRLAS